MKAPPPKLFSALLSLIAAISVLLSGCTGTTKTARQDQGQSSPTAAQAMPDGAGRPQSEQVVVVGDQSAAGTIFGGSGPTNWTNELQRLIGQAGIDAFVRNFARSGAGYTPNPAVTTTFIDDVRRWVNADTDVAMLFGGNNDVESVPALEKSVPQTLEEIKAIAPDARIIVVGPIWSAPEPPPGKVIEANDAIRQASEEFGAEFVDTIGENWFTGRDDLRGADGTSPNDAAQSVIAQRLSPVVAAALRGDEFVGPESPDATAPRPQPKNPTPRPRGPRQRKSPRPRRRRKCHPHRRVHVCRTGAPVA